MEAYPDTTPFWDLTQSNFSELPDDDFLALLQKQFPMNNVGATYNPVFPNAVNPQNISRYSLPSITPPSEDSSPSPDPNAMNDAGGHEDFNDPALKRKASDEDFEEGPSSKSQHTSGTKKSSSSSRRKSGGAHKDEGRLMKRKEQNRAAQRAFRERKEKHVKDLEDKVAALEAKNDQAASENENLRDLLSRLQNENVALKQSSFTFAVPKAGSNTEKGETTAPIVSESPVFSNAAASPAASTTSQKSRNPLEWSSLAAFDPTMLNLLDDSQHQPTATDGAMQMDFGFGGSGLSSSAPYTTIAHNPTFMSFTSTFDHPSPGTADTFTFDINSLSPWPTPSNLSQTGSPSLDDLFGGYVGQHGSPEYSGFGANHSSASISPVTHHSSVKYTDLHSRSPVSSSSSPASSGSDPSLFSTHGESSTSDSDMGHTEVIHTDECPRSREETVKRIAAYGASPFAPSINPNPIRKAPSNFIGNIVQCNKGSNLPKTAQSDQNIEVLSAWRSITSHPRFKDADINELCTEFSDKARCDGTKVVLEPQGVHHILESFSNRLQ